MENRMEPGEKMAENGEGEKHELENNNFKKKKKREVGGIKTMPFILGEVSGFTCSNQSFVSLLSMPISVGEIRAALNSMGARKAPGLDGTQINQLSLLVYMFFTASGVCISETQL